MSAPALSRESQPDHRLEKVHERHPLDQPLARLAES